VASTKSGSDFCCIPSSVRDKNSFAPLELVFFLAASRLEACGFVPAQVVTVFSGCP
jgi:hypothetical protein